MDQKQFERLQAAVQFVVDEDRLQKGKGFTTHAWEWNQGTWGEGRVTSEERLGGYRRKIGYQVVCPTGGCLAGTVVIQNGDHLVVLEGFEAGTELVTDYCMDAQGQVYSISVRAEELLGLEGMDGEHDLFCANNTAETIVLMATEIAEGNGYQLEVI